MKLRRILLMTTIFIVTALASAQASVTVTLYDANKKETGDLLAFPGSTVGWGVKSACGPSSGRPFAATKTRYLKEVLPILATRTFILTASDSLHIMSVRVNQSHSRIMEPFDCEPRDRD